MHSFSRTFSADNARCAGEFVLRRLPTVSAGVEEVLLLDSSAGMLDRARQQQVVNPAAHMNGCWLCT